MATFYDSMQEVSEPSLESPPPTHGRQQAGVQGVPPQASALLAPLPADSHAHLPPPRGTPHAAKPYPWRPRPHFAAAAPSMATA